MNRARKSKLRIFAVCAVTALVMFVLLWLAVSAAFGAFLSSSADNGGKLSYNIGTEEKIKSSRKVSRARYLSDGEVCMDFSELARLCSLKTSGDMTSRRFIFTNGDEVTFFIGGREAYVNGEQVLLDAPAYLDGDDVFVPCSFASVHMNGITVTATGSSVKIVYDAEKLSLVTAKLLPLDPPVTGQN